MGADAETGALSAWARMRLCVGLVLCWPTKTRPASMPLMVPEAVSVTPPLDAAFGSCT